MFHLDFNMTFSIIIIKNDNEFEVKQHLLENEFNLNYIQPTHLYLDDMIRSTNLFSNEIYFKYKYFKYKYFKYGYFK